LSKEELIQLYHENQQTSQTGTLKKKEEKKREKKKEERG
jgi:hypothetical protein